MLRRVILQVDSESISKEQPQKFFTNDITSLPILQREFPDLGGTLSWNMLSCYGHSSAKSGLSLGHGQPICKARDYQISSY